MGLISHLNIHGLNGALIYHPSFDSWVGRMIRFKLCYDFFNNGLIHRLYYAITIMHGGE